MGISVKIASQKAAGLSAAAVLKAAWVLKKRNIDLRNLRKSKTFIRDASGIW
jgi:hypothetical protein